MNTTDTGWPTGGTCFNPECASVSKPCCGLRQAISAINDRVSYEGCAAGDGNNDTIILPNGTYTATSSLIINRAVTIRGNGVGWAVLRGNMTNDSGFLWVNVEPEVAVNFEDLTIDRTSGNQFVTGIYVSFGGLYVRRARIAGFTGSAIVGDDADMFIFDSTIENNSSFSNGGAIAFYNPNQAEAAYLRIDRATLANNRSDASGGAIYYAGWGGSDLINVTISGNRAVNGGGIFKEPSALYLLLWYTTVAYNTATSSAGGIGIFPEQQTNQGVQLFSSLVANNSAPNGPDLRGQLSDFTESLLGNASGTVLTDDTTTGFIATPPAVVDAKLDPVLRDLGGPYHLKVHRLRPGSPAIDSVFTPPAWFPGIDERQVTRPQFGGQFLRPDMGAFELNRLETEVMSFSATTTNQIVSGSQYSNGAGTNLLANTANHHVTFATQGSLPAGTYAVKIGYKRGSNGGRFRVRYSSSLSGTFLDLGPEQQGYASSNSWVTVNLPNVTFSSTSKKYFRFFVTGNTSPSTGFQIFPDFIELTRLP